MKKIVFGALFFASITVVNAQEESNSFQIKAASVQVGVLSGSSSISNISDFQKLAPTSDFQELDVIGFRRDNNFFGSNGPAFSMNVILAKPANENFARLNTEFRFGVSYQQSDVFNLSYSRTDEFRVDTLTSMRNGEQSFVDSIYDQSYYLAYTQRHVMLDGDVTISTNPNKRFKFYGGVGLSLGLSVSPSTTISYNTTSRLRNEIRTDDFNSDFDSESTYDSYRNKSGFFGRLYLPLGIDFRVGKTNETLKKYHLFVESRTSLMFQSVPELNFTTNTGNATTMGLRYDF